MKVLKRFYEWFMFGCVILSIGTIWYTSSYNSWILWGTWTIFFIDYVIRFLYAEKKWAFIKANPFDLIALIPLDAFFQTAKIARLFRIFRLKTISKRYANPLIHHMKISNPKYVGSISFAVLLIATVPFYYYEPLVLTYKDAFMWAIGSVMVFGNRDLQPETEVGKIMLILLTVFGVCLHAFIIGTLFKLISRNKTNKHTAKNKGL